MGPFEGLTDVVKSRIESSSIGFDMSGKPKSAESDSEYLQSITSHDLMKYGLIPEFVGRLPIVRNLSALDEESYVRILTEPKNSLIKQFQAIFEMEGVRLHFDHDSILRLAKNASKKETGARGLRSDLENVMIGLMYEIPSMKGVEEVTITEDVIQGKNKPKITYFAEKNATEKNLSEQKKKKDNDDDKLFSDTEEKMA